MPDHLLFVSHVTEDRAAAAELVEELERRGIACWIAPRDVRPGGRFDDQIADAIDECLAMLLVFSDRCNDSDYIYREVTVAGEARKPVIPLRIEEAQPRRGLRMRLTDLHWIDAFVAREQAIEAIVRTVRPPPAVAPPNPGPAMEVSAPPATPSPPPPASTRVPAEPTLESAAASPLRSAPAAAKAPPPAAAAAGFWENHARQLLERAEAGDAKSCFLIAGHFLAGTSGIAKNEARAVAFYRRAAELGDAQAQQNLGSMYEYGRMIPPDAGEAVAWYRKSADQGYSLAQSCLGSMYLAGKGVPRDPAEAAVWYRKSADQGFAYAQYNLGRLLLDGEGVARDSAAGLGWLRKAADQNDPQALSALALMHEEGVEVPRSIEAAVDLYLRAADERNFKPAKEALRRIEREHGIGRPKPSYTLPPTEELEEALRGQYTVAPNPDTRADVLEGNLAAIGRLGYLAVEPELKVYWYRLAAERGHPPSQYQLGFMHHRGTGVAQDIETALGWYRKAADQGYGPAQWSLGNAARFGEGVPKDCGEALRWYRMAAEGNHDLSMKTLGDLYETGQCVEKDPKEALAWYRKAAERGNFEAKRILEKAAAEATRP